MVWGEQKSRGSLVYPKLVFYKFVFFLERIWIHNQSLLHHSSYGSALNKEIGEFIASSDRVYETLDRDVIPLLVHESPDLSPGDKLPREIYEFILEKFLRMRQKDAAKNENAQHDPHRRHESTAGGVSLRSSIKTASAAATSKATKPTTAQAVPLLPKTARADVEYESDSSEDPGPDLRPDT